MSLGKWHPNVRSPSSKSSTVKSILHDLNRHSCSSSLKTCSCSCSALTDRDLKADVRRNRSWACDVDLGRPLRRRSNVLLDCANRVCRRQITLCETPKRLATSTCLMPASSIPIARKRFVWQMSMLWHFNASRTDFVNSKAIDLLTRYLFTFERISAQIQVMSKAHR